MPDEVRANMLFTFVSTMDDVFRAALLPTASLASVPAPGLADHPPVEDRAASSGVPPVALPSSNGGIRPTTPPLAPVEPPVPIDTLR